jgi:hypothetical protein
MDFLFCPEEKVHSDQLLQGDVLIRSGELAAVLSQAHQYYATAETYNHFIVITQSCDLVRRGKKAPKAPYITIAAVRPLELVLERHLARLAFLWQGNDPLGMYDIEKREQAAQLLERLLNNEEKGYFFLKAGSHPSITEDLCAFLPLSVALKSQHYDALLRSKVAQLDALFAAKLGWLVGNQYSRVATPDLEELGRKPEKTQFLNEKLSGNWISGSRWRRLGAALKAARRTNPDFEVNHASARQILETVPGDVELLAERSVEILRTAGLLDPANAERAFNLLANDGSLTNIAKGVR